MSGRKVGRACTAKGCLNKSCSGKHQAFRLPTVIERARLWAIKCDNKELVQQLDKVCSDHFESLFPALERSSKKVPIAKENNKFVKGILFGSSGSSPGNNSEILTNLDDKLQIKSEPPENINMEIKQEDLEDFPEYINIANVKNEIVDHRIEQEEVLIKNEPEDTNEQFNIGDVKTEIVEHTIEEEELLIKDEHEVTNIDQLEYDINKEHTSQACDKNLGLHGDPTAFTSKVFMKPRSTTGKQIGRPPTKGHSTPLELVTQRRRRRARGSGEQRHLCFQSEREAQHKRRLDKHNAH